MSKRSHARIWLHLIWRTKHRQPFLNSVDVRIRVSHYLYTYAESKNIYMKKNYVNAEHVHALILLPTKYSIEEVMRLLKGGSSRWINKNGLIDIPFKWSVGYAVFSVSNSMVPGIVNYIANQGRHHRNAGHDLSHGLHRGLR